MNTIFCEVIVNIVLIVDHRPAFARLLEARLRASLNFQRIVYLTTAYECWHQTLLPEPYLIVMGIWYDDGNGLELCLHLIQRSPHHTVLFWTEQYTPPAIFEAHQVGAAGIVAKRHTLTRILSTIHNAQSGKPLWTQRQYRMMHQWQSEVLNPLSVLTERETQIATTLALRRTNREIADHFYVSERTVEGHVSRILEKMSFATRIELAQWAERVKWDQWIRFRQGLKNFYP